MIFWNRAMNSPGRMLPIPKMIEPSGVIHSRARKSIKTVPACLRENSSSLGLNAAIAANPSNTGTGRMLSMKSIPLTFPPLYRNLISSSFLLNWVVTTSSAKIRQSSRFMQGPAKAIMARWYRAGTRAGFTGTEPHAIPNRANMKRDWVPICLSGLSVRWPERAAVSSPTRSAVCAWAYSWQQIEKAASVIQVK